MSSCRIKTTSTLLQEKMKQEGADRGRLTHAAVRRSRGRLTHAGADSRQTANRVQRERQVRDDEQRKHIRLENFQELE